MKSAFFDYIPIIGVLVGFLAAFLALTGHGSVSHYLILTGTLLALASMTILNRHLSDFGRKNNSLASLAIMGIAVAAASSSSLSQSSIYLLAFPAFYLASASIYISKHLNSSSLHTIPPAASGIVIPLVFIFGFYNPLLLSGWLTLAGAVMFFKFGRMKSKNNPSRGGEVDLEKVPIF